MNRKTTWLLILLTFAFADPTRAQQTIFVVRHGETVAPKGANVRPLSEAGQRRATLLATLLKDAGVNVIFTSDADRAVKTAEPLANALRIEPKALGLLNTQFKQNEIDAFAAQLESDHRRDTVLIVAHSNSVPALLKAFGHPLEANIPETEFDNLFVLIPTAEGPPKLLRLHY
jgi:broad specificity phosphatase PhoE